ncbi:MAG: hypothetical protein V4598_15400 [Bdellovibrionota bacterium]
MKTLSFLILSLFIFSVHADVTVCAPKEFLSFDPHQSVGPLESYLVEQLYMPFFASNGKAGVIKGVKKLQNTTWEFEITPDIKFQALAGWKPTRNLSAADVVYSVQRQLSSFAKSVADEESFIPVKMNGLEKSIESIKATDSMKVVVKFRKELTRENLDRFFAFPVGTVLSREFADSGKPLNFFPAYGKFEWTRTSPSRLSLKARNGKDIIHVQGIQNQAFTFKLMKDRKCDRLYYPSKEIVKSAQEKKIPVSVIPVSSSKIYFRFNNVFAYANDVAPLIPSAFHPSKFRSLSERKRSNQFFGNGTGAPKAMKAAKSGLRSAYLYYCIMPQLENEEMAAFMDEVREIARDTLKLNLAFAPLPCEQLSGLRPAPDTLGVLTAFEYRAPNDILETFNCSTVSRNIFGFCQNENLKQDVVDRKLSEMKMIFPLAQVDSSLVIAF